MCVCACVRGVRVRARACLRECARARARGCACVGVRACMRACMGVRGCARARVRACLSTHMSPQQGAPPHPRARATPSARAARARRRRRARSRWRRPAWVARRAMVHASHAVARVAWCTPARSASRVARRTLRVACRTPRVACCVLHAARCVLRGVRCALRCAGACQVAVSAEAQSLQPTACEGTQGVPWI